MFLQAKVKVSYCAVKMPCYIAYHALVGEQVETFNLF
jgi:hypothetical protein